MNTLPKEKLDIILKKYLAHHIKQKNEIELSIESIDFFNQAIQFCRNTNEDFPNLDLIATTNPDQAKDRKYLFDLLDQSLEKEILEDECIFKGFNEEAARSFYDKHSPAYIGCDNLQQEHAASSNFGIIQKYMNKDLSCQEWLTDLDLRQLAKKCELENCIITTFDWMNNVSDTINNIGMELHFLRQKLDKEDHPTSNLSVPLLLNLGSSGYFFSQGSHWVSAILNVDMNKKEIHLTYRDSFPVSENNDIKKTLGAAVQYNEIACDEEAKIKDFKAFPDFHVFVGIDHQTPQQTDGWSCGYRALKNVVAHLPDNKNENFKKIQKCSNESNHLADCYYHILLDSLETKDNPIPKHESKPKMVNANFPQPTRKKTKQSAEELWEELKQFCLDEIENFKDGEYFGSDRRIQSQKRLIHFFKDNYNYKLQEFINLLAVEALKSTGTCIDKMERKGNFLFDQFNSQKIQYLFVLKKLYNKAIDMIDNECIPHKREQAASKNTVQPIPLKFSRRPT